MTPNRPNLHFPLWQFLNQPLFDAYHPLILSPRRFWSFHQIRHLERCWTQDSQSEKRSQG